MGALVLSYPRHCPNELVCRIALYYRTGKWDILHKGFMMTFSFEDGFDSIDEALQEVKATIFSIPQDPLDLIQPE